MNTKPISTASFLLAALMSVAATAAAPGKTQVSIVGEDFHINGRPTYSGRVWRGHRVEGLLLNTRMVQAVFDDRNPETVSRWAYPDTRKWDAERNVREFIAAMPLWKQHGLLAVTVNFQGGSPEGYSTKQTWETGGFTADGALREDCAARMRCVLDAADEQGLVVIVGYFYFGQDQWLRDEAAVVRATDAATHWLLDGGWRNVLVEVNNETDVKAYDHDILRPDRIHELITRVRQIERDGRRLLVGTSYGGGAVPKENVVRASDFLLMHGNGVGDPARITQMVKQARAVPGYRPMPILFNEDDHENFDQPANNCAAAVAEHVSWGWFDFRRKGEGFDEGYQSPPVNWGISSARKRAFFDYCAEITGSALALATASGAEPAWRSVPDRMITRWGREVQPDNAWREYPRPQLEREAWSNLNGLWDYAITAKTAKQPDEWQGKILVPFAVESTLSGVGKLLEPDQALWYRRTVELQPKAGFRTKLNFEAVDYQATVWVNNQQVGQHIGGNTAFSFDITDQLKAGANGIVVRVWDGTGGTQLRGKQTLEPGGIWYTRVSGVWQTVWLEEVPARHVADVTIQTAIRPAAITLRPHVEGPKAAGGKVRVTASFDGKQVAAAEGGAELILPIPDVRLWSPAHPHLYDLKIELLDAEGQVVDTVKSYVGIREVGQRRDADGHLRFTLNGEEIFHWGTLDQGWWPDGLLTPPSDAAMRFDVEFLKSAGFNMIRKHIKVEPRRYYTHCDRIGILLWQDQVSGGTGEQKPGHETSPKWTRMTPDPADATWSDDDHSQWMREFKAMMDQLRSHPSIVVWVPFNEAWGQHRSMDVGKWVMEYDPSRLVNIASGGNFWPVGHVADEHKYPDPWFPFEQERFNAYVKVVGEFGGHGWPVEGHLWNATNRNWGYGGLPKTKEEYLARYQKSLDLLVELKAKGISAGIYTQTTDVENEINGLMTYDREVMKTPPGKLAELHERLGREIQR